MAVPIMITTFTINGIDLDSNTFGGHLSDNSSPFPGISNRSLSLTGGGRDGNTFVVPSEDSPIFTFTESVPIGGSEAFLALMDSNTLLIGHDSRQATAELLTIAPGSRTPGYVDYLVTLRIYDMFWRDTSVGTTAAVTITSGSQVVPVMSGISAPVRDTIIRLKGSLTNPQVTDTLGTFFQYIGTVSGTNYLRFESATGRAYITTSNVWTGGTEVTGSVLNGPTSYFFSLTPLFSDPVTRSGSVTVTSTAQASSPTIEVRAAGAYRI